MFHLKIEFHRTFENFIRIRVYRFFDGIYINKIISIKLPPSLFQGTDKITNNHIVIFTMQISQFLHSLRLTIPADLTKVPIIKLFSYNIRV